MGKNRIFGQFFGLKLAKYFRDKLCDKQNKIVPTHWKKVRPPSEYMDFNGIPHEQFGHKKI